MPISFTVLNSAAWPCINDCAPPMISVVKFPEVGLLGEKAWYVLRAPKYLYCSYCSYCSWGSQGKNTEVACHSLLQWTTLCQTSPPWPSRLGWPHRAWLSFTKLDQAVVCVIRLTNFLYLWFQCVYPLMPSHNSYGLTWFSLTHRQAHVVRN